MYLFTEETFVNITLEHDRKEMDVETGETMCLMASYDSYPHANISWYKDNKPLVHELDGDHYIRYSNV